MVKIISNLKEIKTLWNSKQNFHKMSNNSWTDGAFFNKIPCLLISIRSFITFSFSQLERSRTQLLQQSLRQLNSQFGRRLAGNTPFSVHKVKVSFKDEQGEGSGLARSFYTAISNAFLADEKLPSLDFISASGREGQ